MDNRPSPYPPKVLEHLQAVELKMLQAVDTLCREYNMDYFVLSGTLLGAVRHGGFIPWDDDIDIAIPYRDYQRFLEVAPRALPKDYRVVTARTEKGFAPLWAKVFIEGTRFLDEQTIQAGCNQAIFLDVFPYCQLEKNPIRARHQLARAIRLQRMSYLHHMATMKLPGRTHRTLIDRVTVILHHTIARMWTPERLGKKFVAVCEPVAPGDKWFSPGWAKMVHEERNLFPTCDISFEGLVVRGPSNPDACLRENYGDWRTLPPMDERYTHAPLVLDFGDGVNAIDEAYVI